MNVIVFLLLLLSVTTLMSRKGMGTSRAGFLTAPVLILFGYLISPQSLGIILPSAVNAMSPALRVAVFWVAFLVGLDWRAQDMRAMFFPKLLDGAILLLMAAGLLSMSHGCSLGATLVLGGIFFSGADLLSLILVTAGMALLAHNSAGAAHDILISVGFALVLAVCSRLIMESKSLASSASRLILVGIAILGSGLAFQSHLSIALVAFLFGGILMALFRYSEVLPIGLRASEEPIMLIVYFFLGIHLKMNADALAVGAALAALRVVTLFFLVGRKKGMSDSALRFSRLAAPLVFSVFLTSTAGPGSWAAFLITALASGLVTTELIVFGFVPEVRRV